MNHGIVALEKLITHTARDDAAANEDVDLVGGRVGVSDLVRKHHNAEIVFLLECVKRVVEIVGRLRVEAERRLVQE